ncbi:DUF1611 domain-containing protein [Salibacterium salarium]|uniref:DUF1611 domain-containing protein n=1 Tax=Salibacterium salarium TaxID=284579 RepID=A0A3R9P7J8_9BACI|nr:DUF1611 domain-containing protein [Salibacterium salarium]RSL33035.1 DUF1611 domain-containing protein [Salibacterium salarium]
MKEKAIIYCEANFGTMDGKTANGLVRNSKNYDIVGVIDSTKNERDAGEVIEGKKNGIPIFKSLEEALHGLKDTPDQFIYGLAPAEAFLKTEERAVVMKAMEHGLNIVNTLHEFFTDDPEFIDRSQEYGVHINDVRRPPQKKDMRLFSGKIFDIDIPVVAVLGTDSAVGKRTTSVLLEEALIEKGLHVVFIATGQTGLIQGAKYGVAIDAIPSQYAIGELENQILKAYENENPDIIIVEGQGALSHPAYISSCGILRGSRAGTVIVQHPPKREYLGDFGFMKMPAVASEIGLIENFSTAKVIAVTINHENMNNKEIEETVQDYEKELKLPTTDVLKHGCDKVVQSVFNAYPSLKHKVKKKMVH